MTRQSLSDLNDYLFEELDRLSNDDLQGEALRDEIARANSLTGVAEKVIAVGELTLKAVKFKSDRLDDSVRLPGLLGVGDDE
jgi:hypothetical protein